MININELTIINDDGVIFDTQEVINTIWDMQRPHVKAEIEEELKHKNNITEKQKEMYHKIRSRNTFQKLLLEEYGNFIFIQYQHLLDLLKDESGKVDLSFTFRFIYLATYMDYDNTLRFGARFRGKYTGFMTLEDLPEVMGLSRKQIWEFKKKLEQYNLITVMADESIIINKDYCKKGKINKSYKKDSIRCFKKSIQELYLKSLPKEHRKLGMFIQLLPYLNFNHNVLCFNPDEEDAYKIKELSIQDIAAIVGYTVSQARRLQKDLFKITVGGEYVIGRFTYGRCPEAFIINPAIYYKGNKLDNLAGVVNLFKLGSKA